MQEMQDLSSTPESEWSLEENVNALQYACLGNPMDREAWYPTVPGVAKSLSCLSTHTNKIYSLFYFFFDHLHVDVSKHIDIIFPKYVMNFYNKSDNIPESSALGWFKLLFKYTHARKLWVIQPLSNSIYGTQY